MDMQLGFSFDISRCSGCMACIVACQDEKDLPETAASFRQVTRVEKGSYPRVMMAFVSIACLHCGDAPCLMVCPVGAIYKRTQDGIVGVDQDLCIGCHSCLLACPFGAPQFPDGTKMHKCDLCVGRIEHGMEPACVRVCTTRALGFGSMEELSRQKAEKASRVILDPLVKVPGY
ncbi:MAG: 4Fe-4S dicluster domain-containing protein [Deltaproteobacteria bacterium]|nr:4Fe-4S dicluster domain-containing protein [Deltaproteobacteria bacterium]